MFIIKLKGIKNNFSKDPIDYKKIRKEDVHRPKNSFFKKHQVRNFNILKTSVTEIKTKNNSDQLLLFVHGGAFISGPSQHHWDSIQTIAQQTNHIIWMCDYPKAPEHKISEISENIDSVYTAALEQYTSDKITLIGDSVGGTLITALVQRLIKKEIKSPKKLILVCPVMDATMSNPEIDKVDVIDPMLSKTGILSAKKMCVGNRDLTDPIISPLNASLEQFPDTIFFLAEHDIMYPDQQLAIQKLIKSGTNIEVIEGKRMPHIWPFLPVMKEAKIALQGIIKSLNN